MKTLICKKFGLVPNYFFLLKVQIFIICSSEKHFSASNLMTKVGQSFHLSLNVTAPCNICNA